MALWELNHLHINGHLDEGKDVKIFCSAQCRGVLEALSSVNVKSFGELGIRGHTLSESVPPRIIDFPVQEKCGSDLRLKVIGSLCLLKYMNIYMYSENKAEKHVVVFLFCFHYNWRPEPAKARRVLW